MNFTRILLSCLLMGAASGYAAEPPAADEKVAEVAVKGIKNPELKPYRVMSAGLDAFDDYRGFAPNSALSFTLVKKGDVTGRRSDWQGVNLRLAGNDTSIPVAVAADGTFVLPRSKEAYDDDADLVVNQKKSAVRFWLDVRTPGFAPNVRRLGDIRLECRVIIAIAKKELNFAQRALGNLMFRTGDWCSSARAKVGTPLADWSLATTLSEGARHQPLGPNGNYFFAPIQDKSWSDDALVEFEFWGGASAERKRQFLAQWPLTLKTSVNQWAAGPAMVADEQSVYRTVLALKPGSWKFNLESQGREVNLGVNPGAAAVQLGADQPVQWYGQPLSIHVEQAGTYAFALDLHDPDHPSLTVRAAEAAP